METDKTLIMMIDKKDRMIPDEEAAHRTVAGPQQRGVTVDLQILIINVQGKITADIDDETNEDE